MFLGRGNVRFVFRFYINCHWCCWLLLEILSALFFVLVRAQKWHHAFKKAQPIIRHVLCWDSWIFVKIPPAFLQKEISSTSHAKHFSAPPLLSAQRTNCNFKWSSCNYTHFAIGQIFCCWYNRIPSYSGIVCLSVWWLCCSGTSGVHSLPQP